MDTDTRGPDFISANLNAAFYGFHACLYSALLIIDRQNEGKFRFGITRIASAILFLLCTTNVIVNLWEVYMGMIDSQNFTEQDNLQSASTLSYALVDFVAQSLLLYRCWIIWEKRYTLIVFPALLSVASLAAIMGTCIGVNVDPNINIKTPGDLETFAFSSSLTVNAIVTGLIVTRIWILTHEVTVLNPQASNRPYRVVIAMLLESGSLVLFSQICWLILYIQSNTGFDIVTGAITQIYGFTPTVVLVRVALGASYDSGTMVSGVKSTLAFRNTGEARERSTFMSSDRESASNKESKVDSDTAVLDVC